MKDDGRKITKKRLICKSPDGEECILEVLANGQQWLLEGWHKSGAFYEWKDGRGPLQVKHEEILELNLDDVNAIVLMIKQECEKRGYDFTRQAAAGGTGTTTRDREPIGPDHPDVAPDLESIELFLKAVPCNDKMLADRDEWIKVLGAIKVACAGNEEFYTDVVYPWLSVVDGNDEDYCRGIWESFHDGALGWSYLLAISQDRDPELIARVFRDDGANWDALDDDVAANTKPRTPAQQLNPDERVIADQFVKQHAKTRWIAVPRGGERVQWYRNERGLWVPDDLSITNEVGDLCVRVSDAIRCNPNARPRDFTVAKALQSYPVATHVKNYVKVNREMHVAVDLLNSRPWLLGFEGGYIDERGNLHDPDPSLFITNRLGCMPDYEAEAPLWEAALSRLCGNRDEEAEAMMRWWGYSLSGTGREQAFLYMHGTGGLGITTLLETIAFCAGSYGTSIRHSAFTRGNAERFGTSVLADSWYVYSSEIDSDEIWADATLKTATGSGMMPIEEKGLQPRKVPVRWGITFQGNNVPRFKRIDGGLRRRPMLARFEGLNNTDPASGIKIEKDYARKLFQAEGPAILARLLQARWRYHEHGLLVPARWRAATAEYFDDLDRIGLWLAECCEVRPSEITTMEDLYASYCAWYFRMGFVGPPGSQQALTRALKDRTELRAQGVRFDRKRMNTLHAVPVALGLCVVGAGAKVDLTKI